MSKKKHQVTRVECVELGAKIAKEITKELRAKGASDEVITDAYRIVIDTARLVIV